MKKICFLIGDLSKSGGTERATTIIANQSSMQGYIVSILSLSNGKESFFALQSDINIYSLYPKSISFKKKFVPVVFKIRKFVKLNHIDTLIVVDSISCIFSMPALCGLNVRHICWEHFNFNNNNEKKLRDVGRRIAVKYCDYVVTLTKRDKELWEQRLKIIKAKIFPIANPSPYENIQNIPSLDFKVILSVGRLTNVKGFDLLIKAWAQVCQTNNDWTLRIVGSGEEEKNLKEQAKELGVINRISFVAVVKDVEPYYRTSSFYCLSSRFEGLPMVLLEAQAFGLPIISFDCEVGPSEIITDQINGWLVPPQDTESMKEALLKAIDISYEDYTSLSKNSIINSKLFAVHNIIHKWLEIV